ACQPGWRRARALARCLWQAHRRRNGEAGKRDPGSQHQGGLTLIRCRYSITSRYRNIGSPGATSLPPRRRNRSVLIIRNSARPTRGERGAFAGLTRDSHVAAHHARELAGNGEAKPGAAKLLGGRPIGLADLLEQLCLLLRCHADAGVSDRELNPVATVGDPARPPPDLPFLW